MKSFKKIIIICAMLLVSSTLFARPKITRYYIGNESYVHIKYSETNYYLININAIRVIKPLVNKKNEVYGIEIYLFSGYPPYDVVSSIELKDIDLEEFLEFIK